EPAAISVGAVLRAVDGPLAGVRGQRPEDVSYEGAAEHLPELWIAVRAAVRNVLDEVTVAQVASGKLPARVKRLVTAPDAWEPR
ncbi:MAG TPA: Rrf2 family transcriptional regulator, partial [Phytomonospora sp.]